MVFSRGCVLLVIIAAVAGQPTKPSFWKGTPLDASIEEMRSLCANDDVIACMKYKFVTFLDSIFKKDSYKLTDGIEVTKNSYRANEVNQRGERSLEDNVQEFIQSHDLTFKLPVGESSVTVGSQNIENGELDLKLKFTGRAAEARKSKLKKIIIPILVFVLLKAITLIPLALGVLGLKAWNALQLSFFSFVVSVGLAIFQLCKKIAADSAHPQIAAHGPWEAASFNHYSARSFDTDDDSAQQMAYNAYF